MLLLHDGTYYLNQNISTGVVPVTINRSYSHFPSCYNKVFYSYRSQCRIRSWLCLVCLISSVWGRLVARRTVWLSWFPPGDPFQVPCFGQGSHRSDARPFSLRLVRRYETLIGLICVDVEFDYLVKVYLPGSSTEKMYLKVLQSWRKYKITQAIIMGWNKYCHWF